MAARQYHIACGEGDVGRYVLLTGDPARCAWMASRLDCPRFVASNREFTSYTGLLKGEAVSVCSTGIGGPSAAIAVEELAALGAHTFVRIGTCGGISEKVRGGDLVIPTASVRQEGTTREYVPIEFPAVADYGVVAALKERAVSLGVRHHVGVVQSKDSFYGQHSPDRMPVAAELRAKWTAWKKAGVLASEMETAAIFVVSSCLGLRAGAVLAALWNQEIGEADLSSSPGEEWLEAALEVALGAMERIIQSDRASGAE